mmetsp:Transcript_37140/g.59502  ORF Transcript_37140/g.59502 Transcript_37140/m.59502 type:complete len:241 (+) Transcript_37140:559-1281(+)
MAQDPQESKIEPFTNGVEIKVLKPGDGKTFPKKNDYVIVEYKGRFHGGAKHDQEFDTNDGKPYKFKVGEEIKGWNQGIKKMSLGEKSILKIPHRLAFGIEGYPEIGIAKCQDLVYEIELMNIIAKLPSGVHLEVIERAKDEHAKSPQKGDKVRVAYVGRFHGGENHGQKFEDSGGKFHEYHIGVGKLIRGWDEAIPQMKYGETAMLKVSADYAYGKKGAKGQPPIPPNQDLQFMVTLAPQ